MRAKGIWVLLAVFGLAIVVAVLNSIGVLTPQANELAVTHIEIPGRFGIVGLSGSGVRAPKVTYTSVWGQEIVVTFSEALQPEQTLPLMYLQMGHPVGVGGDRAEIDDYHIEGNRLVVIARRGGIPTQFVALCIPAGILSAKGGIMNENTYIFFSSSALGPHQLWQQVSLIRPEAGHRPSLVIPRLYGEGRRVMYARRETQIRDASGKVIRTLQTGENIHVLQDSGRMLRVRLYAQKSSPLLQALSGDTDIYDGPFVTVYEGLAHAVDFLEVPAPLNPLQYVIVTLSDVHSPYERKVAMAVSSLIYGGFYVPINIDVPRLETLVAPMTVYPMYTIAIVAGESYRQFRPFTHWPKDYYASYRANRDAYISFVRRNFALPKLPPEIDSVLKASERLFLDKAALHDAWVTWGALYGGEDFQKLIQAIKEALPHRADAVMQHFSPALEDPSTLEDCFMNMWNYINTLYLHTLPPLEEHIYKHPCVK